ncbi:hypothetical protein GOV10_02090, partial [Candidatus Woesearchaeota archaeon]|nr:hypothetical protein [Candidatus Woesearchaeota archaeon]
MPKEKEKSEKPNKREEQHESAIDLAHIHVISTQKEISEQLVEYMHTEGFERKKANQKLGKPGEKYEWRLFLVSPEKNGWVGLFEDHNQVDTDLARYFSSNLDTKTIRIEPRSANINTLIIRDHGEVADDDEKKHKAMTDKEVVKFLTKAGVPEEFQEVDHYEFHKKHEEEDQPHYNIHSFYRPRKLTEKEKVAQILEGSDKPEEHELTLDELVEYAVGDEKLRPVVKSQLREQMESDGVEVGNVRFVAPHAEGHLCQRYDSE